MKPNRVVGLLPDLALAVAVASVRGEPEHGVARGGDEGGRDGNLVLGAGRDVEADLADDGHVEVVHQRHLQALAPLVEELVVEGLFKE